MRDSWQVWSPLWAVPLYACMVSVLNFLNIIIGIKSRIAHGVKRKLQCECVCFVNVFEFSPYFITIKLPKLIKFQYYLNTVPSPQSVNTKTLIRRGNLSSFKRPS